MTTGPGPAAGPHRSVLWVTAEPDERLSSVLMGLAMEELASRPGIRATTWYLRAYESRAPRGSRVVDALRTWLPARALAAIGLERLAGALRGHRLRSWFRQIDPDVVILDDGLGARILDAAPRRPVVVVRLNGEPPRWSELEASAPAAHPDALIADRPDDLPPGPPALANLVPLVQEVVPFADRRAAVRAELDLGANEPVVFGWGDDGWLDGPDLFVRALWYLRDRHGVSAQGVWLGCHDRPDEREHLFAEAERCGLAGRLHLLPFVGWGDRLVGDVAFVPHRYPSAERELYIGNRPVVTFGPVAIAGSWLREVPYLDLEAAAAAIAEALAAPVSWPEVSIPSWVDQLLSLVDEAR